MARKTRSQRISYVLPLPNATAGHRLGVNGLAVDHERSILYSAGRDGVIYSWNAPDDVTSQPKSSPQKPLHSYRQHVQAHTHWINDIVLAHNGQALVSGSSDNSVKIWRPHAQDSTPPQIIGSHSDYVKCLASPGQQSSWVASGGLDKKIYLWDLQHGNQKSVIQNVTEDTTIADKGAIYALCANENLLASGGPESVVKIWDSRTGKRVTKFLGHTDNIRSILISQDSNTVMTASSDQSIKIWSLTAGRCLHTLTMHTDSVWCLESDHPHLSTFYSGDRSGLIAKTDLRGAADVDDGLSVSLVQEHDGICKIASTQTSIWTATAGSSVNRWADVDTSAGVQLPDSMRNYRFGNSHSRARSSSSVQAGAPNGVNNTKIPMSSVLRISNTASFPPSQPRTATERSVSGHSMAMRKTSTAFVEPELVPASSLQVQPVDTIQGQNGLIKHILLNDRRRVLTMDTAGEVTMWDLIRCKPISTFGKRHLEDVLPEVNTEDSVAHWCTVDTRTGTLTCTLEEKHCFDAEMYADELKDADGIDFREDQRINLGKWVLRYLFADLLDEEIRRDEQVRRSLFEERISMPGLDRPSAPNSIAMPQRNFGNPEDQNTPRATNGRVPMMTPGMGIGLATPGGNLLSLKTSNQGSAASPLSAVSDSKTPFRPSSDKSGDYFTARPPSRAGTPSATSKVPSTPSEPEDKAVAEPEKANGKESGGLFGKKNKFRMSFVGKKPPKPVPVVAKPVVEERTKEESDAESRSSKVDEERERYSDCFYGVIHQIRYEYQQALEKGETLLDTLVTPCLPNETPVLKPPMTTTVLIQEESHTSAGMTDLFEGRLDVLKQQANLLEKVAPFWLGDLLLRNKIPVKEIVKVSFTLEPYDKLLPYVTSNEGTERLNANRMLRARKILGYVAERLEPDADRSAPDTLAPEEYLELYCQDKLVHPKMTLANIRTRLWRGGADIALVYKANGRKRITAAAEPENPFADENAELANGASAS